jgi:23S rRNA pseudouridine1911/1915/1917 synthase
LKRGAKSKKSLVHSDESNGGKKSVLTYKVLKSLENYHLLEIELGPGRSHQIRSQLAAIGSPIKGDVKYGAKRKNQDRSIHLHARKLVFTHPYNNELIEIEAEVPRKDNLWQSVVS